MWLWSISSSPQKTQELNNAHQVDVPLILMNSFNTDKDTTRVVQKYQGHKVNIQTFNQSRYPRVTRDGFNLCPDSVESRNSDWYPPGHGDIFESLENSGVLDQLLESGKEYLFMSNIDNLGATVDLGMLVMNHWYANANQLRDLQLFCSTSLRTSVSS